MRSDVLRAAAENFGSQFYQQRHSYFPFDFAVAASRISRSAYRPLKGFQAKEEAQAKVGPGGVQMVAGWSELKRCLHGIV